MIVGIIYFIYFYSIIDGKLFKWVIKSTAIKKDQEKGEL